MTETIPQYLSRVRRSDSEKMDPVIAGMRTTREVATQFGIKARDARQKLHALQDALEVDGFDNGEYVWRVPDKDYRA